MTCVPVCGKIFSEDTERRCPQKWRRSISNTARWARARPLRRTDFLTHLFPGSRRLFELADSITEIKTICECGSKATVNARIDGEGHVVTEGAQVFLGGNDSYIAMCHACWRRRIARERAERTQKEKQ